ncbi:MAG: 3-oxoacyl-[acyl-carrier-protein] synthase 3 [Nitrosomonadaceae bacterium]|nr:3-oxoacyl-[acyl-carrier-protein] synthase 3 [Nitrosomonadaceae bacterium]
MICVAAIGSYIPSGRESNHAKKEKFGLDHDFIVKKLGVEEVSRKAPDEETSDLCVKAFADLESRLGRRIEAVDCLVVCTQNPDGSGLPHTSAVVHGKLSLSQGCACFDISLGCSGYIYSLSILKSFMRENGLSCGLLFTADPYSKIIDPEDKNTVLLFGDAATVTLLLDESSGGLVPGPFLFGTRGKDGGALVNRDGVLHMNGQAVFTFSATEVPVQVHALLKDAGLHLEDINLFLFHQGSRYIVDTLTKRLSMPVEKVPINLGHQGNTISSSLPLLLQDRLNDTQFRRMLLSGFGVGLSWASCLMIRTP